MKIAYYTEALGSYVSGGLNLVVNILNELTKKGHETTCFLKMKPYRSEWLGCNFPIYPSDSEQYENYDGVLISPFSPTAEAVANHSKAADRLYHVNANEGLFTYNGPDWTQRAINSYSLPLKIICVSSYLQIIMEQIYKRNVVGITVPPGIDPTIFYDQLRDELDVDRPIRIAIFNRTGWIRGVDTAIKAFQLVKRPKELVMISETMDQKAIAEKFRYADIYLDGSRLAGSPTLPKEAMACGCVPICTYYGATDYILNNVNGYIVPPDNPQWMANLIDNFALSDKTMNYETATYISENFKWSGIADRLYDAILESQTNGDFLLQKRQWQ